MRERGTGTSDVETCRGDNGDSGVAGGPERGWVDLREQYLEVHVVVPPRQGFLVPRARQSERRTRVEKAVD